MSRSRIGTCKDGTPLYEEESGHISFGCGPAIRLAEAEVAEPAAPAAEPDAPKPEEKESPEDIERRARKPPAEGPCRGCGKNLPLNRLMLCYRCWVIKNIRDRDPNFIPQVDPHPADCGCVLPEHSGRRGA